VYGSTEPLSLSAQDEKARKDVPGFIQIRYCEQITEPWRLVLRVFELLAGFLGLLLHFFLQKLLAFLSLDSFIAGPSKMPVKPSSDILIGFGMRWKLIEVNTTSPPFLRLAMTASVSGSSAMQRSGMQTPYSSFWPLPPSICMRTPGGIRRAGGTDTCMNLRLTLPETVDDSNSGDQLSGIGGHDVADRADVVVVLLVTDLEPALRCLRGACWAEA
jgi:hypothetical protein